MIASKFTDAIGWKIGVEGRPTDIELINDVTDERVVFGVLEHRLGVLDSPVIHDAGSAASAAALVGAEGTVRAVSESGLQLKVEPTEWVRCGGGRHDQGGSAAQGTADEILGGSRHSAGW